MGPDHLIASKYEPCGNDVRAQPGAADPTAIAVWIGEGEGREGRGGGNRMGSWVVTHGT